MWKRTISLLSWKITAVSYPFNSTHVQPTAPCKKGYLYNQHIFYLQSLSQLKWHLAVGYFRTDKRKRHDLLFFRRVGVFLSSKGNIKCSLGFRWSKSWFTQVSPLFLITARPQINKIYLSLGMMGGKKFWFYWHCGTVPVLLRALPSIFITKNSVSLNSWVL